MFNITSYQEAVNKNDKIIKIQERSSMLMRDISKLISQREEAIKINGDKITIISGDKKIELDTVDKDIRDSLLQSFEKNIDKLVNEILLIELN